MKTNILIPTDFSKNAYNAATYAMKLYKNESCTFYLLNSWAFSVSHSRTYVTANYLKKLKEESEKQLKDLKVQLKAEFKNPKHEFKTIISKDPLLVAIKKETQAHLIDLIIMGTKGATGATELFIGSNTVNVINKLKNCPILIIPNEFDYVVPRKIAFSTDFNRFYGEELEHLIQLANLHKSKISVIHINEKNLTDKQNYNLAMLKAYLENHRHRFHWMTGFSKKEHALKAATEELSIDILTMINYQHSFIENIINEPVIKNIGFHPIIPFLVVPCFYEK
ncbi:universal stress protein [Winogradskyella sp. 4-2091]|uniref:universal stress protein n=1 Tax=Winogradskyella sp. 4-2091 TaxID=3381659 RepID=UPI0038921171